MLKVTELEKIHLSTGQLLRLSKLGHKYTVMLASPEMFEAPELWNNLNKKDAYNKYADILKNDVLEIY
jgi:hypothetical protein